MEPDDQSPDEFLELYEPPFKHSSSQSALYQQQIVAEFDAFKTHKENLANTNDLQRPYNKLYNRNLMSSINPTSVLEYYTTLRGIVIGGNVTSFILSFTFRIYGSHVQT